MAEMYGELGNSQALYSELTRSGEPSPCTIYSPYLLFGLPKIHLFSFMRINIDHFGPLVYLLSSSSIHICYGDEQMRRMKAYRHSNSYAQDIVPVYGEEGSW